MHQRAHHRYSPRTAIQVTNTLDDKSLGMLVNISLSGFMLVSEMEHPVPGSIYQLHLTDLDAGELNMSVGATCMWQDEASADNSCWSGFRIIDISEEDQKTLENYIHSLEN